MTGIRKKLSPNQARELLKRMPRKEHFRPADVAKFTGIDEQDVYELILDGEVSASNIAIAPGSPPLYRIWHEGLQMYLERTAKQDSRTTQNKENRS